MLDVLHWLPSCSGSRIGSLLWSGGHCWDSPPPIYATSDALPWVLRVVALSALLSGACSWSLLPALLLSRFAPSQWLAPPSGIGSLWRCDCIPESTLNLSILAFFSRAGAGSAPE